MAVEGMSAEFCIGTWGRSTGEATRRPIEILLCLTRTEADSCVIVGVAIDDVCLYSDDMQPSDKFCEIVALEILSLQHNISAPSSLLELLDDLHLPFTEIYNITLAQASATHQSQDPRANQSNRAHLRSSLVRPDPQAMLQAKSKPDSMHEPSIETNKGHLRSSPSVHLDRLAMLRANPKPGLIGKILESPITQLNGECNSNQTREVIIIDSDDDDDSAEAARQLSPPLVSNSGPLTLGNGVTDSNFIYHLKVQDKGMAKHLGSMNLGSIRTLINNAAPKIKTRLKGDEWITSLHHLSNGDIEICVADEEDFKCLQLFSAWAPNFQAKLSQLRRSYRVYTVGISLAAMGDFRNKVGEESVKQRLVDLNQSRLKNLESAYSITKLNWICKPKHASNANFGGIAIDFAFEDIANEAVYNGIVWDGEVRPCGKNRDAVLSMLTKCVHCQRWGHQKGKCPWPPRCLHCAEDHLTKDCTSLTPRCGLCDGPHDWGAEDCPRARFERVTNLEAGKDKTKMPWYFHGQGSKNSISKTSSNPNSRPINALSRFKSSTWTHPVVPAARERSEPILDRPGASRATKAFLTAIDPNGKYQFAKPLEEHRPASRTPAGHPEAFWQQVPPLLRPAPAITPSTAFPVQPTSAFTFPHSVPSIAHLTPIFGWPTTITPRLPHCSPSTFNPDSMTQREFAATSSKNPEPVDSINKRMVQELRQMREKALQRRSATSAPASPHSSTPKPIPTSMSMSTRHQEKTTGTASGIRGGNVPTMPRAMSIKRKVDENARMMGGGGGGGEEEERGGSPGDEDEQDAAAAKRIKLEQATRKDGVPGLWLP